MYPAEVSRDYLELLRGGRQWQTILNRYEVDVVLWEKTLPLANLLRLTDQWRETFADDSWVVYQRPCLHRRQLPNGQLPSGCRRRCLPRVARSAALPPRA